MRTERHRALRKDAMNGPREPFGYLCPDCWSRTNDFEVMHKKKANKTILRSPVPISVSCHHCTITFQRFLFNSSTNIKTDVGRLKQGEIPCEYVFSLQILKTNGVLEASQEKKCDSCEIIDNHLGRSRVEVGNYWPKELGKKK